MPDDKLEALQRAQARLRQLQEYCGVATVTLDGKEQEVSVGAEEDEEEPPEGWTQMQQRNFERRIMITTFIVDEKEQSVDKNVLKQYLDEEDETARILERCRNVWLRLSQRGTRQTQRIVDDAGTDPKVYFESVVAGRLLHVLRKHLKTIARAQVTKEHEGVQQTSLTRAANAENKANIPPAPFSADMQTHVSPVHTGETCEATPQQTGDLSKLEKEASDVPKRRKRHPGRLKPRKQRRRLSKSQPELTGASTKYEEEQEHSRKQSTPKETAMRGISERLTRAIQQSRRLEDYVEEVIRRLSNNARRIAKLRRDLEENEEFKGIRTKPPRGKEKPRQTVWRAKQPPTGLNTSKEQVDVPPPIGSIVFERC